MKKIILSLLALLICTLNTQADNIESGQTYRICTADGKYALTNGGSTANNVVLKMVLLDDDDEGQYWVFTKEGDYWTIKSALGNVNIDNPSAAHASFNNQLCQWQTTNNSTNQKWTFAPVDDAFYTMIPYENANKCYAFNDDGTFTFQDRGAEGEKLQLLKPASIPTAEINGYYALQTVSVFPSYNYASEGKFLSFSTSGNASLSATFSYEKSRFYISTDDNGILSITMPQNDSYVYSTGTIVRTAKQSVDTYRNTSKFVGYINTPTIGLDTRLALHVGSTTDASSKSNIKFLVSNSAGSGVTTSTLITNNAYCFRLVKLPANKEVDKLYASIATANELLKTLSGDDATLLKDAIDKAQDELDYPYLTEKEIVNDLNALNQTIENLQTKQGAMQLQPELTGIEQTQKSHVNVVVENHIITVSNAQKVTIYNAQGVVQPQGTALPSGAYVVVADGQTFKVAI